MLTFLIIIKSIEAIRIPIRPIFFALVLLVFGCNQATPASEDRFSGDNAYAYLAQQLEFGPRFPGAAGHEGIQTWMINLLEEQGWVTEEQNFMYKGAELTNIIARQPNPSVDGEIILIGAHYDTRRYADRDSDNPLAPVPGANDGASGVAVLLELARHFSKTNSFELMLVFFDAEDQGRIDGWDWAVGSRYFVQSLEVDLSAVVIVDMVGDRDLQLPYECSSDPSLVQDIWSLALENGFKGFINEPR
jgi:hypothetical protein